VTTTSMLPANLCLVTLLCLEQCSQLERFHLQHIQIVSKTSNCKTKLTCNKAGGAGSVFKWDIFGHEC